MAKKPIDFSQGGKIEIKSKYKVNNKNLFQIYTPGVAEIVKAVDKDKNKTNNLTWRKNVVVIVSDGSAILGMGNRGPEAALPVMEAKAALFKEIAGIDAVPIVIKTQKTKDIIRTIENIAPSFNGINLEDISAPRCFEIEESLKRKLKIPVFHDDQHGTAIVILAGLINAVKVTDKNLKKAKIVISGAGAAALATTKLLLKFGCKDIILFDSKGPIYKGRKGLNKYKKIIAKKTNLEKFDGNLKEGIKNSDVFIGLSMPRLLDTTDIKKMNKNPIVFALANPVPEILPEKAEQGGAKVVATGRSDFPNQINNALVFPGIFRGAIDSGISNINDKIKIAAAEAIASLMKKPTKNKIIPKVLDKNIPNKIIGVFKNI